MIGALVGLCAYGTGVIYLLWAPRVRGKKLRLALRITGVVALLPLLISLPATLLGVFLASGNPPAQTRVVVSPRGDQATLIYHAGFLGRDYTEVRLKRSGHCQHVQVFWHSGPSWFVDPQIRWVDDTHLEIQYHTRADDPHYCAGTSNRIRIECEGTPWPQQSPAH
jgi:hypothetical protein